MPNLRKHDVTHRLWIKLQPKHAQKTMTKILSYFFNFYIVCFEKYTLQNLQSTKNFVSTHLVLFLNFYMSLTWKMCRNLFNLFKLNYLKLSRMFNTFIIMIFVNVLVLQRIFPSLSSVLSNWQLPTMMPSLMLFVTNIGIKCT